MAFQFNDREFTKFVNNFERRKGSVEWLDKKDLAGKSQELVSSYATVLIKWDILARPVDVVDFFEKPWKWLEEINLLSYCIDGKYPNELNHKEVLIIRELIHRIQLGFMLFESISFIEEKFEEEDKCVDCGEFVYDCPTEKHKCPHVTGSI